MYYLCSWHRQKLIQLPEFEISQYWLEWMMTAGEHYESKSWEKAKKCAGSAMDLTASALLRKDLSRISMATHTTLSTIYLASIFKQTRDFQQAKWSTDYLNQRLRLTMTDNRDKDWRQTCITAMATAESQIAFFEEYLGLPIEKAC